MLLDRRWDQGQAILARGYVVLVAALFLLFLPFLTAMPVPTDDLGLPLPDRRRDLDLVPELDLDGAARGILPGCRCSPKRSRPSCVRRSPGS